MLNATTARWFKHTNKMKHLILVYLAILALFSPLNAAAQMEAKQHGLIDIIIRLNLTNQSPNNGLGTKICKSSGGSYCPGGLSIGEGICRGGDGSYCPGGTSIEEGICKAGGGSYCPSGMSLGEAICRGGGSYCPAGTSIGTGICKAAGGSYCPDGMSIGEGICKSRGGGTCNLMSVKRALALPISNP